jgi:hypothetical protein
VSPRFGGIASGGEHLAFDFRNPAPPVVMINAISSGWHEGLVQAPSVAKFLAQREAGEPYRWDENHR